MHSQKIDYNRISVSAIPPDRNPPDSIQEGRQARKARIMKNSILAQLNAIDSNKASKNTPVNTFETYLAKVTDTKQKEALQNARKEALVKKAEKAKASTKEETKTAPATKAIEFYIPTNERRGLYLFAYTHAVMQFVKALPAGQQETAARKLHGPTAISYHGNKGNIRIAAGKVSYNENALSCDPKKGTDDKRHGAFTFVGAFFSLITTGKLPAQKPEGFSWKALATKKASA